jgi:hypothetical protein
MKKLNSLNKYNEEINVVIGKMKNDILTYQQCFDKKIEESKNPKPQNTQPDQKILITEESKSNHNFLSYKIGLESEGPKETSRTEESSNTINSDVLVINVDNHGVLLSDEKLHSSGDEEELKDSKCRQVEKGEKKSKLNQHIH